jgi:hypothetical protein
MKGRFLITTALAIAIACGTGACGRQKGADSGSVGDMSAAVQAATDGEFATLGDIFASDCTDFISLYDENHYTCAFTLGGTCYRVVADLPKGMYESLSEAEFDDQTQVEDLLGPLAVAQQDIIAESVPSQENLDTLAGKRGADLTAEGFVFDNLVVNGDKTDCSASKGAFSYMVTFEQSVEDEGTTDYAGAVKNLTVESVSFAGISYLVLQ